MRAREICPRRALGRSAAALLCLVAVGCGVGAQDTAQRVERGGVPFGLLDDDPPVPRTSESGDAVVAVYFVDVNGLVPVLRTAKAGSGPNDALRALVKGPTADERSAGLRSLLPPGTKILGTTTRGSLVTVDLDAQFAGTVSTSDRSLAFAQIVYTATSFPDVTRVALLVQGVPIEVPRGDGSLAPGPVTRGDYLEGS